MLNVTAVRAFRDNYLWVLQDGSSPAVCVVDPGDAAPVLRHLAEHKLELQAILVTHHHADHIGGIAALLQHTQVPVYGPATPKIPQVSHPVAEGSVLQLLGHEFRVLEVPGHTLEHIAYVATGPSAVSSQDASLQLFCGDTLFAAGCGRMFEGTPPQMHGSLQKLAALPAHTLVYCAHEYTLSNLRFATAVMPDNQALQQRIMREQAKRDMDQATVPAQLAVELLTNPFLRCTDPLVRAAAAAREPGGSADPATVFGILRRWKDAF